MKQLHNIVAPLPDTTEHSLWSMPTASVESINAKQPEEVKIDRNKRIPSEIMPRQSEV